jgi:predicted ATPase
LTGPLTSLAIPATLQDALMARLDRLGTAKGIAQLGATIGRQFAYELLRAVAPVDETTLHRELERLVEAELVYQRGMLPQASYTFKHALIQDVAYQSLLRSTRQQVHQRIAQVLEAQFPEMVETQPELLAHHYTEAGMATEAVRFWQQAGQRASARSAHLEAIAHFTKGLDLLRTLPEMSERAERELTLTIALGGSLMATKGFGAPEVGQVYGRARDLCQRMGETPQIFPALWGLLRFFTTKGEFQTARALGEQILRLAQHTQDSAALIAAHRELGAFFFFLGELEPARHHFEQGIALYDRQQHRASISLYAQDLGTSCLYYASWALWWLGYPDQALQRSREARALADELSHPFTVTWALLFAAEVHQYRREFDTTEELAQAALALATEQQFAQVRAAGMIIGGWAQALQGQTEVGLAEMRQGIDAWRASGTRVMVSHHLALLAEAYGHAGHIEEGLNVLVEALDEVNQTGQRSNEAEIHCLRGELLLQQATPDHRQAEACFQQALNVARNQHAKSFELRAATSLARLWQSQDKRQEAYDLLAPVYNWFTEGFDTADLQEAKALLDELV